MAFQKANFHGDFTVFPDKSAFLNHRLASGMVAAGPLPFFVQAYFSIGQGFGCGAAHARHQRAVPVYVVVTHIQHSIPVRHCNQMPFRNAAARIRGGHDVAVLPVME